MMNKAIFWLGLCGCLTARAADVPQTAGAARPRAVPVGSAVAQAAEASAARAADEAAARQAPDGAPAKYTTTDKWILAGYNNNEIVYTIIVANDDTRILHCTALMQGWYYENGKKLPISDRQSATVFPNQPTELGNWMDMDQASGATYSVKCRPM